MLRIRTIRKAKRLSTSAPTFTLEDQVIPLCVLARSINPHPGPTQIHMYIRTMRIKLWCWCCLLWFCNGKRNLIINGNEAVRGRFPYMASLANNRRHQCGGTLIAPDIVLTAAHCGGFFEEIQLGRHDLLRDTVYESYVIQDTAVHPRFFLHEHVSNDIDHFDFMLIKIYGESGRLPVRLNRNQRLPTNLGDPLVVIGWGTTQASVDAATDLLREVTIDYIPNERCQEIVGTTERGIRVNLAERVTGVTLCAADFDEGQDSCQGDSGGPILIASPTPGEGSTSSNIISNNPSEDIQVGLTSFGIDGCADETFPGFYARTSHAQRWIDDTVCAMSNNPPSSFQCQNQRDNTPDYQGPLIRVHIEFKLGTFPSETGWILQSTNDFGVNVTYASKPIFSYRNARPLSVITESVTIPNNRRYFLVLLDQIGNGICCGSTLRIYDSTTDLRSTVSVGSGFSSKVFPFTVGVPPTPQPTQTPQPSATVFPSSAPTITRPYITIRIRFDRHPSETGWFLEALSTSDEEPEVLAARYPGDYQRFQQGDVHTEVVNLLLPSPTTTTYRFTMTDNEGDGMCCGGYAQVFDESNNLLFNFSTFFLEDMRTFAAPLHQQSSPSSSSSSSISRPLPFWWWCIIALLFILGMLR